MMKDHDESFPPKSGTNRFLLTLNTFFLEHAEHASNQFNIELITISLTQKERERISANLLPTSNHTGNKKDRRPDIA